MLVGYVYGCYGLLIGAVWRRELESIFTVILLTNIDVGWLQNPLFYTEAENKSFVRWLPAYWPSQAAMVGAFTDHGVGMAIVGALAYGTFFVLIAIIVFWRQLGVAPSHSDRTKLMALEAP